MNEFLENLNVAQNLKLKPKDVIEGKLPDLQTLDIKEVKKIKDKDSMFVQKEVSDYALEAYAKDLSELIEVNEEQAVEIAEAENILKQLQEKGVVIDDLINEQSQMTTKISEHLETVTDLHKREVDKVEKLERERDELLKRVGELSSNVEELKIEVEKLESRKTSLETERKSLEKEIVSLRDQNSEVLVELQKHNGITENQIEIMKSLYGKDDILRELIEKDLLDFLEVIPQLSNDTFDILRDNPNYLEDLYAIYEESAYEYYTLSRDINKAITTVKDEFSKYGVEFGDTVVVNKEVFENQDSFAHTLYSLGESLSENNNEDLEEIDINEFTD